VLGAGEDVLDRALLDGLAGEHHHHPLGDLGHHPHVVGDEQHRHPDLLLQQLDEIEDLGLDGDVQGGGRLIRDEQRRAAGERHGDHGALAHAAGELMGVLLQLPLGLRDAHQLQHLQRQLAGLAPGLVLVEEDRLLDLVADLVDRVE
jgi:hypothetical protein